MLEDMEIEVAQKSARMVQVYCRKYAGLCHFYVKKLQICVRKLSVWEVGGHRRSWTDAVSEKKIRPGNFVWSVGKAEPLAGPFRFGLAVGYSSVAAASCNATFQAPTQDRPHESQSPFDRERLRRGLRGQRGLGGR